MAGTRRRETEKQKRKPRLLHWRWPVVAWQEWRVSEREVGGTKAQGAGESRLGP